MKPEPEDDKTIIGDLVEKLISGELTEREANALDAMMERNPRLIRSVYQQIQLDSLLRGRTAFPEMYHYLSGSSCEEKDMSECDMPQNIELDAIDFDGLVQLAAEAPALSKSIASPPNEILKDTVPRSLVPYKPPTRQDIFINRILLAGILFFLVFVTFVYLNHSPNKGNNEVFRPLAMVTAAIDVDGGDDENTPIKPGRELQAEKISFQSGLVELLMKNGVSVILEGPVDFNLNTHEKVFCGQGKVSVYVPESGVGFEVATPMMNVIDLGTEFSLSVENKKVETHLITGQVELTRIAASKRKLAEGKAFQITDKGETKEFAADRATYRTHQEVLSEVQIMEDRQQARWKSEMDFWNNDSGLLLALDFEGAGNILSNRAVHRTISNATLTGGRKGIGRWKNKAAVEFRNKTDAIEIDVPTKLQSMTLSASIKVASLKRYNQVLLSSETLDGGHVLWQIRNDGVFHLAIQNIGENTPQRYVTKPMITRDLWGAWYHVACVYDAETKKVIHYLDGNQVDSSDLENTGAFNIGKATIGNARTRQKNTTDRSFDGSIDHFLIFNRALSSEEIQRLHSN